MSWQPTMEQALKAINARRKGVFDDANLLELGALSTVDADITRIKRATLESYAFTIGARDPQINSDFPGKFMVVEGLAEQLPCKNAAEGNGDWALVGDNLDWLINESFGALHEMCRA